MLIRQISLTPDPYEPFLLSQAHRVGDLVFVSGQTGIDGDGRVVGVGQFETQARQALANLDRVLRSAGSSLANVVKVTIFLTDMTHFEQVVELRRQWFTPPYPADTIVEVRTLYAPEVMFEVEAVAVVDDAAQWLDRIETSPRETGRPHDGEPRAQNTAS